MKAESCAAGLGGQSHQRPCGEVRGQREGFIGIDSTTDGLENSPTAKKKKMAIMLPNKKYTRKAEPNMKQMETQCRVELQ